MGEHLRQQERDQVYTVGLFAGQGRSIRVDDGTETFPIIPELPVDGCGAEQLLGSVSKSEVTFVDLASVRSDSGRGRGKQEAGA